MESPPHHGLAFEDEGPARSLSFSGSALPVTVTPSTDDDGTEITLDVHPARSLSSSGGELPVTVTPSTVDDGTDITSPVSVDGTKSCGTRVVRSHIHDVLTTVLIPVSVFFSLLVFPILLSSTTLKAANWVEGIANFLFISSLTSLGCLASGAIVGAHHLVHPDWAFLDYCRALRTASSEADIFGADSNEVLNGRFLQARGLGDGYMSELADALSAHFRRVDRGEAEQLPSVARLNLIANRFGVRGISYLARALHHRGSYTELLSLGRNDRLRDRDVPLIVSSVAATNITMLGLTDMRLTWKGMAYLAPLMVGQHPGLHSLWLDYNRGIGDSGAVVLAKILQQSDGALEELGLLSSSVCEEGASAFADMFPQNKRIKHLKLQLPSSKHTCISDETLKRIEVGAKRNCRERKAYSKTRRVGGF